MAEWGNFKLRLFAVPEQVNCSRYLDNKKNKIFACNSLADRTFQDLTQYPIFPWIISDFTANELDLKDERCYRDLTKPMGALNSERLKRLKERFDEMGDPKLVFQCSDFYCSIF